MRESSPPPGTFSLRRALFQGLVLLAVGSRACVYCDPSGPPAAVQAETTACGPDLCIDLGNPANAALREVHGSLLVEVPDSDLLILVRTSSTSVLALSALCTHEGCLVRFDDRRQILSCPCHGSGFAQSGQVLSGPAHSPLRSYPALLKGNQITVTLG